MPPLDVSLQDRQRAIQHMQFQLQRLQQPAEKAASMASKVEEAAYNKATNKHEYMQFLQNSMKKAQAALHRQAHVQHQAAQHQAAQHQAAQHQAAQQQAAQQQAAQQQAAQQQQQAAIMAQQAQAQHQAAAQQQAIAQQQAAVQAQFMGQPQYMQQQAAQPQYLQQAQQQYVQQQAQQPQQPQYVQQQPAPQPAPQQYMQQQSAPQQMYRQQAPAGQAPYMQHQVPQQPQYVQQQAAQPPQPQYMQQPTQQTYVQQPAAQQYMQQQPAQQQYMHQQAQQQQQYMQQQVPQSHYIKQQPAQPQYVQQQQQQQPAQPHYMPQQPAHQAMPQQQVAHQAVAQQQAAHQPAPQQQPQYMPQQQAPQGQAQLYKAQAPVQHQQMPAQHHQLPQQQYVQQPGGSGYTVQQYGAAQAGAAMQQQVPQPGLQPAPMPGQPPGLQPRQLAPGELARLPSFDDPAFGDFAAELFPDSAQPAAPPRLQQAPQVQPARYTQHPQQQNAASPSVAESSAPAPGRKGSPALAQAREASSAAGAAGAAGGRRPPQHVHDPQALREFLRVHAAFNNPASRAQTIKDSERMLQFYRDSGQSQPAVAERMAQRVQRSGMMLRLLMTEKPHLQLAITDQVLKFSKAFIRELAQFRDMMKRNSQKLATAGSLGSASTAATAGSGPSAGGFLAMMESGDSEALKLTGPLGGAAPPAGAVPAKLPATAGAPAAAAPAAAGQALPSQAAGAAAAASAAAEAARQQALARQRQLAEANAEQQRRREAAAAASAALPAAGPPRLVAAAQQARSAADVATVQGGFRRLQKVLAASEQRLLGLSPPQGVSTPPLPDEVQRLVARERAAMEEAAAATKPGAGSGQGGAAALLTEPCAEGHAERQQAGKDGAEGAGPPAAKRQRSASPEAAGAAQARQRSQLELRLAAECSEAAAALGGALSLQVATDAMEPSSAMVTCIPRAAQAGAADADASSGGRPVPPDHQWQVLLLRVPPGYPKEAPTAVFPRTGHGGASDAAAAAAARHQQLLDACRERFAASLALGPSPPALPEVAKAWLAATQAVATHAGVDEAA